MAKFDYDDTVYITGPSIAPERIGQMASVIAIFDDRERWPLTDFAPGVVYSIEFEDGQAIEVHEAALSNQPPRIISAP